MTVNKLALKCGKLTRCFASQINALSYSEHREKRAFIFTIITNLSKIEFVYIGKASIICAPSTMFVRIYPLKTRKIPFHLYEFMDDEDFRCTYFSCIESEQRMNLCFDTLSHILLEYLPKIEALVRDRESFTAFVDKKYNTVKRFMNIEDKDIPEEEECAENYWQYYFSHFERFVQLARFTRFEGYGFFLEGRLDKAKVSYEKLRNKAEPLDFEERLNYFIQTPEAENYIAIVPACAAVLDVKKFAGNHSQILNLLKAGGLLYICFLILFIAICLTIGIIRARGTEYYSFRWYVMAPLLAALPALFGSMSLRRVIMKIVNRKSWKRELDFDDILNSRAVSKMANVAFGIVFAVCLFGSVVFSFASPKFYDTYMIYDDGQKFPLLNPVLYKYDNIDTVYHIAGRYNEFGDYIDRGSYVICFNDGSTIDFDVVISENETEKFVLPILENYIGEVTELNSDRNIE